MFAALGMAGFGALQPEYEQADYGAGPDDQVLRLIDLGPKRRIDHVVA